MHNFVLSDEGDWVVVQQGMNTKLRTARRYHWSSENLRSFIEEPHSGVTGENQGKILNLTAAEASVTRSSILSLTQENPGKMMKEIAQISDQDFSQQLELDFDKEEGESLPLAPTADWQGSQILIRNDRNLKMPSHHEVRAEDVDLKRLGSVLATAYDNNSNQNFESLLLTPGLGPRTLQSLTLVSEVIYGTPSRFTDPARFSFAHGGKDGHPFPVATKIYDESIRILGDAIEKSKLGYKDKSECIRRLNTTARQIEENCSPLADFEATIAHEKEHSKEWGGRTCMD